MLTFLGAPDDGRSKFQVYNAALVDRWTTLTRFFFSLSQIKARLGIKAGSGLWAFAERLSRVKKSRKPSSPELEAALKKYFSSDIELLSQLLQRDLSSWLR